MSNINYKSLITPEARAQQASAARAAAIKADCTAQITDVLDSYTLSNLRSAEALGELTLGQIATFGEAQRWVRDMRIACRKAIAKDAKPVWPAMPKGLRKLSKAH